MELRPWRTTIDGSAGLPAEGYTLSVSEAGVLIVGADAAGAFYGEQTLRALAAAPCAEHDSCVPVCEVRDWPELAMRGTIEGFYGTPWSHDDRMEHLRFSGRHKLNVYVYAPKDDPYHRECWREPYPVEELERLGELVDEARRQHVRFVFAISPGLSMDYGDPGDRAALLAKVRQVREVGVGAFALLFDDIPPDPAHAAAHAELCGWFPERPLIMVPTDYAGTAPSPYRDVLAASLPQDVLVWWTGADVVVGAVSEREAAAAASSYGHRLTLWDNFPVNDFDFQRVFLGPLTGRDTTLDLAGITANPMVHAAASQLALATVADWAWNPAAYDASVSHRRAVRLTPGAAELLPLIEACSAWPPGADQSPLLSGLCARVLSGDDSATALLRAELTRLAELPTGVEGRLAAELRPWVEAARAMGRAGLQALDAPHTVHHALEHAEAHEANVLRGVIPPFIRAFTAPAPGPQL